MGLEPNHLVANLWDTTTNTLKDIADPKRIEGKNAGTTVANLLQNTLVSFVPGAYDIGTILRADPTLSGTAGFKALAHDPLIAVMDVQGPPTTPLGPSPAPSPRPIWGLPWPPTWAWTPRPSLVRRFTSSWANCRPRCSG